MQVCLSGCPHLVPLMTWRGWWESWGGQDWAAALFPLVNLFLGSGCAESLNCRSRLISLRTGVCLSWVCGLEHVSQSLQGSVLSSHSMEIMCVDCAFSAGLCHQRGDTGSWEKDKQLYFACVCRIDIHAVSKQIGLWRWQRMRGLTIRQQSPKTLLGWGEIIKINLGNAAVT